MKLLHVGLILLFLAAFGSAQDFEYGESKELKGLKKVFIDAGPDVTNFKLIKDELVAAKLPNFEVVGELNSSDFVILFRGGIGVEISGNNSHRRRTGKGYVSVPSSDGKRLRILMNFDEMQDMLFEKKPAVKFTREFIKLYKKANDLK